MSPIFLLLGKAVPGVGTGARVGARTGLAIGALASAGIGIGARVGHGTAVQIVVGPAMVGTGVVA